MEYDNDQEEMTQDLKYQERQSVFDMNNIQKGQLMRIKQLFDLCNRNGRPRPCDDFDHKKYTMFYSKNDPYFYVDRTGVYPNRLKIYNKDDIVKTSHTHICNRQLCCSTITLVDEKWDD